MQFVPLLLPFVRLVNFFAEFYVTMNIRRKYAALGSTATNILYIYKKED